MLCCIVSCCVVLCCVVLFWLCCVVSCYVVLCCVVLCFVILCCVVFHCHDKVVFCLTCAVGVPQGPKYDASTVELELIKRPTDRLTD